ncbi:hypothetical protein [Burkholderia cepacia]|uniref:hypothetical protein n=1 Tax=Burkholderia cepacia TaxID=292 RepID=UPI001FC8E2AF|nr:hypothetical protein [Burkholderia cepacia]
MTVRPAITATRFGDVDTDALERLESSSDTTYLLAAADIIDRIHAQLHDSERLHAGLLEILSMAHSVLSGVSSVPS